MYISFVRRWFLNCPFLNHFSLKLSGKQCIMIILQFLLVISLAHGLAGYATWGLSLIWGLRGGEGSIIPRGGSTAKLRCLWEEFTSLQAVGLIHKFLVSCWAKAAFSTLSCGLLHRQLTNMVAYWKPVW